MSARPGPEEETRAPHRLYGYLDGARPFSAADWAADARDAVRDAHESGRVPILVGGTGLYIRTLLDGIAPVPAIDPGIRRQVRALPLEAARAALEREDPDGAARIAPGDSSRTARALEVVRSTGLPLSAWQDRREGGIRDQVRLAPLVLLPPRDWLYARCDARFERMLTDEGTEEVRALVARNLPAGFPVMRAIGVPQVAAWLAGEMDRGAAIEAGRIATRRYAKRQYTWFRHQADPDWPRYEEPLEGAGFSLALARLVESIGEGSRPARGD